MSDSVFVGIDVSSQTLEVASSAQAKTWQVGNDAAGIEQLTTQLMSLQPALVVLEATGGYEFEPACALQASGLAVTLLRPSVIFGAEDRFLNLFAGLQAVAPVVPLAGADARFQPVWVGDVARAILQVLDAPKGSIKASFELSGPRYWTYAEITREVARALGKRRIIVPMPVPLIGIVAGLSEAVRFPFPVATDQLRQLALDNIGALDAVERELGFVPVDMGGRLGYLKRKIGKQ